MRFFRWKDEPAKRREPTPEERAAFEERLLGEDLEGARVVAMEYAMRLANKNPTMARELVDRACSRLWENCSWDPKRGSALRVFLCGLVRSERSKDARQAINRGEHETEYLTEVETLDGAEAKSPEELMIAREESIEGREEAARRLQELRRHFEATGDEVNLKWIEYSLDDIEDLAEMARLSGRPVDDFYRARDRRVRYVQRLRAKKQEKE